MAAPAPPPQVARNSHAAAQSGRQPSLSLPPNDAPPPWRHRLVRCSATSSCPLARRRRLSVGCGVLKEALPTSSGYLPSTRPPTPRSSSLSTRPVPPSPRRPTRRCSSGSRRPGCSGQLSNFLQLGPYSLRRRTSNHTAASLSRNPFAWNRRFGLLFLDSPLGTGFSAAPSTADIPRSQPAIAEHVLAALQSFFDARPAHFRARPFFLTGESYAGKYVPATASRILAANTALPAHRRIGLRGVAIGNGLVHPVTQVATYADTAYFMGLINGRQRRSWVATGLATLFDVVTQQWLDADALGEFVNRAGVKAALGARGDVVWEACAAAVVTALREDGMKSAKPEVEALLRREGCGCCCTGVRDLRDGVASAEAWLEEVDWDGMAEFREAERAVWRTTDEGELAGYVQRHGTLAHVVVYGTGHFVPAGKGRAAQEMIEGWVSQTGVFGSGNNCDRVLETGGGSRHAVI
ncbi:hypothetical protein ZWY2020_008440 [Hordeum vulgare]|nr:hypothetical protein ZWY2020_008440 [Hordeum vulgare]